MTRLYWRLSVNCKTEAKAHIVLKRTLARMGEEARNVVIEPYHDPTIGGFNFTFDIFSEEEAWNDRIVEVIEIGQRVALGWSLTGDIRQPTANACSKEVLVPGAIWMQWLLLE